jgi:hypothetical protein
MYISYTFKIQNISLLFVLHINSYFTMYTPHLFYYFLICHCSFFFLLLKLINYIYKDAYLIKDTSFWGIIIGLGTAIVHYCITLIIIYRNDQKKSCIHRDNPKDLK